ncbi:hypothetical protein LCGC14_1309390 [marine sediment metagenome]|uniref:VCBS repeat-containing protein n=1 Tax=marine sediment metagenome TaxID=412755 RepID=A0A0F9NQA7_9ZZZZ
MPDIFRKAHIFLWLMASLILAAPVYAEDTVESPKNPFASTLDVALQYFTPMEGTVDTQEGDTLEVSLDGDTIAAMGARFGIFRKGAPYLHPVTKQVIVQGETSVGTAEVTASGPGWATLVLINGEAGEGDVVRVSSGKVKALFYQKAGVDWDIAEEYYFWLKDTGRFTLAESVPGKASNEEIAAIAREWDTDIAIIVDSAGTPAEPQLRQTLMWVSDYKVFSVELAHIRPGELSTFKKGEEYFIPDKNIPTIEYRIPHTATLIAAGDIDGDGEQEILLAAGSSIHFFSAGATLEPAFKSRDEVILKGKTGQIPVWLETADLDRDGLDEILLSVQRGSTAMSFIYEYKDSGFSQLWQGRGFIRAIGRTLYTQTADPYGGMMGSPEPLDWKHGGQPPDRSDQAGQSGRIPEVSNIYNLVQVREQGQPVKYASFNKKGHLTMLTASGEVSWVSEQRYRPFNRDLPRETIAGTEEEDTWTINDRMIPVGSGLYAFKRVPRKTNIKIDGLGYKKTVLMGVYASGNDVKESMLIDKLRSSAIDFVVSGDRLYVLSESLSVNLLNLFKGKKVFTSKLTVYLMRGEQ